MWCQYLRISQSRTGVFAVSQKKKYSLRTKTLWIPSLCLGDGAVKSCSLSLSFSLPLCIFIAYFKMYYSLVSFSFTLSLSLSLSLSLPLSLNTVTRQSVLLQLFPCYSICLIMLPSILHSQTPHTHFQMSVVFPIRVGALPLHHLQHTKPHTANGHLLSLLERSVLCILFRYFSLSPSKRIFLSFHFLFFFLLIFNASCYLSL